MAVVRGLVGKVTAKPFGKGSKSERAAVVLESDDGEFVLRRIGGNAFQDDELDKLVGKTIEVDGETRGYLLVMTKWKKA